MSCFRCEENELNFPFPFLSTIPLICSSSSYCFLFHVQQNDKNLCAFYNLFPEWCHDTKSPICMFTIIRFFTNTWPCIPLVAHTNGCFIQISLSISVTRIRWNECISLSHSCCFHEPENIQMPLPRANRNILDAFFVSLEYGSVRETYTTADTTLRGRASEEGRADGSFQMSLA